MKSTSPAEPLQIVPINHKPAQHLEAEELIPNSETAEHFRQKCIFITGATGFCGKVFLEKVLRSLSSIKKVYVLLRKKGDCSAEQRLKQLLDSRAFTFHSYDLQQFTKLVAIEGDISLPNLGLSSLDQKHLTQDVNIVYHIAASVKFDAEFKFNYTQNTLGAKNVLNACRPFVNLEQYIHVSTAYSNCQLLKVPEQVWPLIEDIDVVLEKLDALKTSDEMEKMARPWMEKRPNSYVFTKALAEQYVNKHPIERSASGADVRTAIVRPAIVYNAISEPAFGWIDSFNGPSGFSLFLLCGLVRYTTLNLYTRLQLVPVDFLANFLVCLSLFLKKTPTENNNLQVEVYQLSSGPYMVANMFGLLKKGLKYTRIYPSMFIIRRIVLSHKTAASNLAPMHFKLLCFIYHQLWSYCIEAMLIVTRMRSRLSMLRLVRKYYYACRLINYFIDTEWQFETQNYERVLDSQSATDARLFPMNMRSLQLDQVCESYVLGARRYLLKEKDETIRLAQIKYKGQLIFAQILDILFWLILGLAAVRFGSFLFFK